MTTLDGNTRNILSDALAMYAREHRMASAQRQAIEFALNRLASETPSVQDAEEMGKFGSAHSESERALYEAYCKGHCWAVSEWNPKGHYEDMLDRIRFAMWRDRAALKGGIKYF